MAKRISGTREWAAHSVNCISGCAHNCRYCYARARAIRFGQKTMADWPLEVVRPKDVAAARKYMPGRVMFPTTHDITPVHVAECMQVLDRLLAAGNEVLVVSKPHVAVILHLCGRYTNYRDNLRFRFTIGTQDEALLDYWEPGAPAFLERWLALSYAKAQGYSTSVSIEPMLWPERVGDLVVTLLPYVTDTIWLGKMNKIRQRVAVLTAEDRERVAALEAAQTDEKIRHIYGMLQHVPQIRWKESIKEVVGLPLADEAGQDI